MRLLRPLPFRLLLRLEPCNPVFQNLLERLIEELGLELDARGAVGEGGGCLRAVEEEHVGEFVQGDADGRAEARCPVLGDGGAVRAADVELGEGAGDGVKPRGEHDGVEVAVVAGFEADAGFGDGVDGVFLDGDDVNVVVVEAFVVVLFERGPLRAPGVWWFRGCEEFFFALVFDAGPDEVAPEVVGFEVGLFVVEHVAVGVEPVAETALRDQQVMIGLAPLLRRVIEGLARQEVVIETGEGVVAFGEGFIELAALLKELVGIGLERVLVHGAAEVGSALVDGELFAVWRSFLDRLNAAGASADDGDALVFEVEAFLGPFLGMLGGMCEEREGGRTAVWWMAPLKFSWPGSLGL